MRARYTSTARRRHLCSVTATDPRVESSRPAVEVQQFPQERVSGLHCDGDLAVALLCEHVRPVDVLDVLDVSFSRIQLKTICTNNLILGQAI